MSSSALADLPAQPESHEPPPLAAAAAARPYLQRPLPAILILGTFFALTVPLCAFYGARLVGALSTMESIALSPLAQVYLCGLGLTHFFLTFTIYFQSGNLRHFASSTRNRVIFFAVPIGIFVFFDLYHALGIDARFVGFATALFIGIRFFDFLHFNRQNFGVHQLFKGKAGSLFPPWMRKAEQGFFLTLVLLIFHTFLTPEHRADLASPLFWLLVSIAVSFFSAIAYGYTLALRRAPRPSVLAAPFGYLLVQTASAALAVYSTALYLFCLAIHYVEYHVLMAPRCFKTRLDQQSPVDRLFGHLRRSKIVFYVLLLGLSALTLWMFETAGSRRTSPLPYLMLIHVFDGLFVFHYFVEAFIWKFGDPYFRQSLGPLYFPQPATVES